MKSINYGCELWLNSMITSGRNCVPMAATRSPNVFLVEFFLTTSWWKSRERERACGRKMDPEKFIQVLERVCAQVAEAHRTHHFSLEILPPNYVLRSKSCFWPSSAESLHVEWADGESACAMNLNIKTSRIYLRFTRSPAAAYRRSPIFIPVFLFSVRCGRVCDNILNDVPFLFAMCARRARARWRTL